MIRCGLVLAFALCAGCSNPTFLRPNVEDDAETKELPREGPVSLPPLPQERDLREFAGPLVANKYFLDARTFELGKDGIVRYTAVIKTAGGATNVTYEGIRCATAEKKLYAIGREGTQWIASKRTDWIPIRVGVNELQSVLYKGILCDGRVPVGSRAEVLRALTHGPRDHHQ